MLRYLLSLGLTHEHPHAWLYTKAEHNVQTSLCPDIYIVLRKHNKLTSPCIDNKI
jgi:hypothetical protein